jgi:APA family basic amino acid/polyamine antiporter
MMVAVAVLMLRRSDPARARSFRVPAVWLIAPLTIGGCVFLFLNLPTAAMLFLPGWTVIGWLVYFAYSRSRSHLGRGIFDVPELAPEAPGTAVPPMPGAPAPGSPETRG